MRLLCLLGRHKPRPLASTALSGDRTLWTLGCDRCGRRRQHVTNWNGRIVEVFPWT